MKNKKEYDELLLKKFAEKLNSPLPENEFQEAYETFIAAFPKFKGNEWLQKALELDI